MEAIEKKEKKKSSFFELKSGEYFFELEPYCSYDEIKKNINEKKFKEKFPSSEIDRELIIFKIINKDKEEKDKKKVENEKSEEVKIIDIICLPDFLEKNKEVPYLVSEMGVSMWILYFKNNELYISNNITNSFFMEGKQFNLYENDKKALSFEGCSLKGNQVGIKGFPFNWKINLNNNNKDEGIIEDNSNYFPLKLYRKENKIRRKSFFFTTHGLKHEGDVIYICKDSKLKRYIEDFEKCYETILNLYENEEERNKEIKNIKNVTKKLFPDGNKE